MRLLSLVTLVALTVLPAGAAAQPNEPFGLTTLSTLDEAGRIFQQKWGGVLAKLRREQRILVICRRSPHLCAPVAHAFLALVESLKTIPDAERVTAAMSVARNSANFVDDREQWGVPDRWSPAFETLYTGSGDCEDFAILAYALLIALGMEPDDLRPVVVKFLPRMPRPYKQLHMMLAVRTKGEWRIFDPSRKEKATGLTFHYRPLYVLDTRGVRSYQPSPTTIIAAR